MRSLVPTGSWSGPAEVTRFLDLPVAGGEQDYDLNQWKRITWMHAVDIAQPDVCYIGGISRCLRAARMAEQAGMPVVPHSANLSLVTVFTMHLLGAIPNAGPHFEYSIEKNALDRWPVHADPGRARRPWCRFRLAPAGACRSTRIGWPAPRAR